MFQRKAVNPGGDGRKGDGARADLRGDLQRGAVAGGEQRRLVLAAAVPHRADAVDDVVGLEVEALGVHRLPGRAAADPGAGLAQVLSRCTVDGAAHRSEEHTSELQSLMRISYAVFCLKKNTHCNTLTS